MLEGKAPSPCASQRVRKRLSNHVVVVVSLVFPNDPHSSHRPNPYQTRGKKKKKKEEKTTKPEK
jgi:hypothetical protein